MSDVWDFYILRVDDEPASIYLNLGLIGDAPIQNEPHLAYLRIVMRQPRPDGLSSQEEFDDLIALEDAITDHLVGAENLTYVGRNTSGGHRDFYFYTDDPDAFAAWAFEAMDGHRHYQFQVGGRPDPQWDAYRNFLYPSPDDLQRILNRRVLAQLAEHEDNSAELRRIDHVAILPSAAASVDLGEYLRKQGFTVNEPAIDGGAIVLSFEREDKPDQIDEVVLPIAQEVRKLGGDYDGWGCEVVRLPT